MLAADWMMTPDVMAGQDHVSSTKVVITVLDQNDNAPVFSHSWYQAAAREGAMNQTILQVGLTCLDLKILPSSHSSATWCIMVNVSMWCLPTTVHKEWCARYYCRNDKESYTFQPQNPFILQPDVHTNIPETNQLSFSINQR